MRMKKLRIRQILVRLSRIRMWMTMRIKMEMVKARR